MDVISCSTDSKALTFEAPSCRGEAGVHISPNGVVDEGSAILRAEYQVDE